MLLGLEHEIPHHLGRFRILEYDVFFLDHGLHEVLVDCFAEATPEVAVVHDEEMVAAGDQAVADVRRRPVAVDGAFLVYELLDGAPVCEDDGGAGPELEGIHAAILLRPFRESMPC